MLRRLDLSVPVLAGVVLLLVAMIALPVGWLVVYAFADKEGHLDGALEKTIGQKLVAANVTQAVIVVAPVPKNCAVTPEISAAVSVFML